MTRNAESGTIMTPRVAHRSAHNFIDFFYPNQKSLSLKMAKICPILEISCFVISHDQKCTDLPPNLNFFIRNLYATKMQSFINLGRKIFFKIL